MCPVSARSIIHDGSSEHALSVLRRRSLSSSPKCNNRLCVEEINAHMHFHFSRRAIFFFPSVAFMWCWVASLRRSPLSPRAGLILFYGVDETGYTAMMDYTADSIDAQPITAR